MTFGGPWKDLVGKWSVDRGENVEEYFKELGVGYLLRKVILSSKSEVEITVEGDRITIHALSSFRKQDPNTFIVNGPETEANFGGSKAKARTIWLDGKLIMEVSPSEDGRVSKPQTITREVINGELVQTMEINGVKAVRYYKRI